MGENKIGPFIAALRKEKKLTQKQLAAQLHITDKAVSKWERGLSCPDITLLAPLAAILGVTTGELLNGQRCEAPSAEVEKTVDNALVYAEKSATRRLGSFQTVLTLAFSALLLLGMMVCAICDAALSGGFTWSLYPISSCLFAWLVCVPLVRYGRKGIRWSFVSLSVFLLPFLYVLSRLIGSSRFLMPLGSRVSLLSIAYLWCVYWLFRKLRARKLRAAAFSLLLAVPFCLAVNATVSLYIPGPVLTIWDFLSFGVLLIGAAALLVMEHAGKQDVQ